jgi:hypothetical protein
MNEQPIEDLTPEEAAEQLQLDATFLKSRPITARHGLNWQQYEHERLFKIAALEAAVAALTERRALAEQVRQMREALEKLRNTATEGFIFNSELGYWICAECLRRDGDKAQIIHEPNCTEGIIKAALALSHTAAEAQAKEHAMKAEAYERLKANPAALHIAILRGDFPISKAQLIHAAGLSADVARKAGLADEYREALEAAREYLYNPFEPDNQSSIYHQITAVLNEAATAAKEASDVTR